MAATLHITEGNVSECIALMRAIPEFTGKAYTEETFRQRLSDADYLILIARDGQQSVGFKVAYDRDADGSLYSWLGGVLPAYRRQKIAQRLAETQENWAKRRGFSAITFKTRNYHKAMLIFALQNGFAITAVIPKEKTADNRIILRKELT